MTDKIPGPIVPAAVVLIVDERGVLRLFPVHALEAREMQRYLGPAQLEVDGADEDSLEQAFRMVRSVIAYRTTQRVRFEG